MVPNLRHMPATAAKERGGGHGRHKKSVAKAAHRCSASMNSSIAHLSRQNRTSVRIVAVAAMAVAAILVLLAVFTLMGSATSGLDEPRAGPPSMGQFVGFGFGGIILLAIGTPVAKLAFLKALAEIAASETAGAVEHAGGALGRGLASAGAGTIGSDAAPAGS